MGTGLSSSVDGPGKRGPLTASPAHVRPMREQDVRYVEEIERVSFTMAWAGRTFQSLLRRMDAECWVAEDDKGRLLGYAVAWWALDQAELANIAVRADSRGRGLGGQLLDRVLESMKARGMREIFLEVRRSNDVAAAMYRRRDFVEVGIRKNYYDLPREDALVLRKKLN